MLEVFPKPWSDASSLSVWKGLKRSYTCNICNVTLNSIEQYHAHLKGSKHQTNLKNQ
ncbi:finger matrin-type 4-like [Podarcis lilfordi]|uniref:Finger matrin-type 4-like n=1 Tax=Podarcis lilfordi TaxID=74358 RepID=A0AA35QQ44_9SAUR|nr:finger matrin-type 4-like [Podarcis lilfordi]